MKANELMIGDIVRSYDVPMRVLGVMTKSTATPSPIYVEKVNHSEPRELSDVYWTTEEEIFGLRLTPERLAAGGFKRTISNDWTLGDARVIPATNKDIFTDTDHPVVIIWRQGHVREISIRCDYIHELQHALRLCGLEELADNFKI